jgi:hypothetical protein
MLLCITVYLSCDLLFHYLLLNPNDLLVRVLLVYYN